MSHEPHAPHRGRGPGRPFNPPEGRLSKSVAKAPIGPERRRRIVDIPRFFSRPIRSRGAFATDLDTPRPGSSQEPHPHHPAPAHPRNHDDPDPRTIAPSEKGPLRPSTSYSRGAGAVKARAGHLFAGGSPTQRRSPEQITAIPRDARGSLGATGSGFSAASHPGTLMPAPVIGGAPGSARSPGNPRDRHLTAEHVTSPASTSARGTCSRVK